MTACSRCNSSRGNRNLKVFAGVVASYLNNTVKAEEILTFIKATRKRALDVAEAKRILSNRSHP